MRSHFARLVLLAALLTCPRPSGAVRLPAPPAPDQAVRAGDEVVTIVPALPAGAREFELLLVPESGAEIQVSPELPAGVHEVRWRVPRTAARSARLVLRAGGEQAEWESPASESFELVPNSAAATGGLVTVRPPTALRFEFSGGSLSGLQPGPAPLELGVGASDGAAVPAPTTPDVQRPAHVHAAGSRPRPLHTCSPSTAERSRAPAVTPRRN